MRLAMSAGKYDCITLKIVGTGGCGAATITHLRNERR